MQWWLWLWLGACGGSTEAPRPTSTPAPPTADLTPEPQPETEWTTLQGFLPPAPGMPLPLRGLVVGMPAAEAAQRLGEVSVAEAPPRPRTVAKRTVYSILLKSPPNIHVNALLDPDGATVESVQINLPAAEGEAALMRAWGSAEGIVFGDGNSPSPYVWTSDRHRFEWKTEPGDPIGLLRIDALTP